MPPNVKADPRQGVRDLRTAAFVGAAFVLAVALITAFALARERRLVVEQAHQETTTLAALFEENTARTFEGVANALEGVAIYTATVQPPKHDEAARQSMRDRLRFIPTVRALFIIGPDGYITHDTDFPKTPDVSLADRPYFRQYLQDPGITRAVSEALQSRSGTGWFVAVTRRIVGRDGKFLGVAVAAVQLDSISMLYRKLDLQPGQQVALLQSNGTLLALYPEVDAMIGRNFAQLPVFASKLPRRRTGTFVFSGPPWDYERIVSYRGLESQPLVVLVSTRMDAVLAPWKRAVGGSLAGLLALSLLTAGAALFFAQRQRERARASTLQEAQATALEIAAANAKFRAFFEQGSMFACVLDADGAVLDINHTGRDAAAQVLGTKFWECPWWSTPASQADLLREGVARARAGDTSRRELTFNSGGDIRLVELVLSPIRGDAGAVLAIAALAVDITERKFQEDKLRVLAGDLADVDRRRGEFLATLSHELRNVLTPVQNCAQILKLADPASAQARRARDVLSEQLAQMRRLVDDLLDVSRINSGKVHLELAAMDLRSVLLRAADGAHHAMERASHRFDMALPDEELLVFGDAARLQQVFTNLLGNAAKYTPLGGSVCLRARLEGSEAIVEVADNGLGIPVESQASIFQMFEQVGSHAARRQGGLGIGLGLVSRLVTLHGGHVDVFSDGPGCGSTFTVYLPLAGSPGAPKPEPAQAAAHAVEPKAT
jgi:PAS domain S-box-containing protein